MNKDFFSRSNSLIIFYSVHFVATQHTHEKERGCSVGRYGLGNFLKIIFSLLRLSRKIIF
jgi:hypothetical protein